MIEKRAAILILCATAVWLSACGGGETLTEDEKAIVDQLTAWGEAQKSDDYAKAWELMSKDAHDYYTGQLAGQNGARDQVRSIRAALDSKFTAPAEKERKKKDLEKFPPWEQLEKMTPQQYYAWRTKYDVPLETRTAAATFYQRSNIKEIRIDGDRAVIIWKPSDAKREVMVKEDGKWKLHLGPARERELEAAREHSNKANGQ